MTCHVCCVRRTTQRENEHVRFDTIDCLQVGNKFHQALIIQVLEVNMKCLCFICIMHYAVMRMFDENQNVVALKKTLELKKICQNKCL